jgi:transcriptional regulator with XRE-family HTH domain
MTPSLPSSRKARRAQLGAELRRLRQLSGLSEEAIARAVGSSQSAVSRMQTGSAPVSLPVVLAWAAAASATEDETAELRRLLDQAIAQVTPIRHDLSAEEFTEGQHRVKMDFEATSNAISSFQPFFVPGLLQTAAYARQVFATFRPAETLDTDVAARLDRQPILYNPSRRFEFIMTEAALRWHAGPADVLPPQLDRIISVATLASVKVRVIPADAVWRTAPICAFTLYEERGEEAPTATVETHSQREETEDVKPYRDELELLRQSALAGDDAVEFIRAMAR